ncbi:MAG: right-handed parallel beta-helix repeat-containing protein [Planctomycetota bacterium]
MMRPVIAILLASVVSYCCASSAATLYANPGDTLDSIINGMSPGDTLILNPGTYTSDGEHINNLNGTASLPITIMGSADGAVVVVGSYSINVFDFLNCSYIVLKDMEIRHGSNTVKFNTTGTSHHMTLQNLKLHDTYGVSIAGSHGGHHHITISDCVIYDTGMNSSNTGEGIYLSYWDAPVDYVTIERCWIYNLHGVETDGLEFKYVRNAIVRDNVIIGTGQNFPCIKIESADDATRTNLVERNICINGNSGIETYGDCIIRNNIVLNCEYGIYSRDNSGTAPANYPLRNVHIINNTVYNSSDSCLRLSGWTDKTGLEIVGNAFYQPTLSKYAIYVGGNPTTLSGVTIADNHYYGNEYGDYFDLSLGDGFILSDSPDDTFVDPDSRNFFPLETSSLIDAAPSAYAPAVDFLGTGRPQGAADDVGALEWNSPNASGFSIPTTGGLIDDIISGTVPPPDPSDDKKTEGGCAVAPVPSTRGAFAYGFAFLIAAIAVRRVRA